MTIEQAKQLAIGDLIQRTGDKPPYRDCYRILEIREKGVYIEHAYLSIRKETFGRIMPNGHKSEIKWDYEEWSGPNKGNNWWLGYKRIGSNRVGLTQ